MKHRASPPRPTPVSSLMAKLANPVLYAAMGVLIDEGVRRSGSAFTPEVPVWTPATFAALRRHFLDQPDLTPGKSYLEKVAEQFAGAPNDAIQLMAELNYLHFLIPKTTSAAKKRENVQAILNLMQRSVAIPADLDAGLEHGFINPGTYYLANRPAQIAYLIEFGDAFDFTGADYAGWCREAGFRRIEVIPLGGPASAAIAYK